MLKRLSQRLAALPRALRLIWTEPTNRGQRMWRTLRFLLWVPTQGWLRPRLLMRMDNGLLIRARTTKILVNRYESHLTGFVLEHACEGGMMIDIGASVGIYTLQVAPRFEEIVCVEPNRVDATLLHQNLHLNWRELGRFEAHEVAVGETDGELSLFTSTTENFVPTIDDGSIPDAEIAAKGLVRTPIPCRTVDSLVAGRGPVHFMKIDVEGFEPPVLRGAAATIAASPRILIHVEATGDAQLLLDTLAASGLTSLLPNRLDEPITSADQLGEERDFFAVGPEHPLARR